MALFVALTVAKGVNAAGTIQLAIPTSGAGGITFNSIPSQSIGGLTAVSAITVPATGLNQRATVYYTDATVAALVALMV